MLNPQVLADMSKAGVKPDKETYQCLISRHCQVLDAEAVSVVSCACFRLGMLRVPGRCCR